MTTRKTRGAPGALAMLTLLLLLVAVPAARAADPDAPGDGTEGWKKVVSYARCAFLVFVAVTPTDWAVAVSDCARLYAEEPPAPGGGL
jgi:hypothetical protein